VIDPSEGCGRRYVLLQDLGKRSSSPYAHDDLKLIEPGERPGHLPKTPIPVEAGGETNHGFRSWRETMASIQRVLSHELARLPEGFRYEEELLSPDEEEALMSTFERLPFREFEFRGFLGKRRRPSC
jgi:hypothetical protein